MVSGKPARSKNKSKAEHSRKIVGDGRARLRRSALAFHTKKLMPTGRRSVSKEVRVNIPIVNIDGMNE